MHKKIATAKLEHLIIGSARKHLERRGYTEVFPPRLVRASGACENVNTLFQVSSDNDHAWFKTPEPRPAYLAQTAQLYLEALVPYLGQVYCVGPSFRAEPVVDNRHLAEFTMVEIELAGNFHELLKEIEGVITAIARRVLALSPENRRAHGIGDASAELLAQMKDEFPKISYDEAIEYLDLAWGDDISSRNEERLLSIFGNHPLLITHYPDPLYNHGKEIEVEKFFNMIPDPERPGRVQSADLILPFGGEAVGSAARIHDPITLERRLTNSRMFAMLTARGGSLKDFEWYIERINEKTLPHAGCGFGIARIARWLRADSDIRDSVTFPVTRAWII